MNKPVVLSTIILFLFLVSGCAQLKKQAELLKPTAKIVDARLDGINFDEAFILFDIEVDNPNPVSIKLASLAYEMKLENQSLVSGETAKGLRLESNGKSRVEVPVRLKFDDLKKLPGELWNKDEVAYQFNTMVVLNLPVVGKYNISLVNEGVIPVPKLPSIKLKSVRLNNLNLTSAEILTTLEISNPNAFSMRLNNINYTLDINKQTWGRGNISQKQNVPEKGIGIISIPVELNFLTMGRTAYKLLADKETVDYQMRGAMDVDAGVAILKSLKLPLDLKGKVSIR